MEINNTQIDISDLVDQKYMHKKITDKLYLSDYQISILNMFKIDYKSCKTSKELLYLIDKELDEDYDEDLDQIAREISEFDYYNNTKK